MVYSGDPRFQLGQQLGIAFNGHPGHRHPADHIQQQLGGEDDLSFLQDLGFQMGGNAQF